MMRTLIAALAVAIASAQPAAQAQQVALTFDDLPSHGALPAGETRIAVIGRIIAALGEAQTPPVYGFINGQTLIDDPEGAAVLQMWRAAGHLLGNHTWSHMRLEDGKAGAFETDIVLNEPLLQVLMQGLDWRWFRYPFLDESETARTHADIRASLAKRKYRVASVTLNFQDYAWNTAYLRCLAANDQREVARLEDTFLAAARTTLASARDQSRSRLGRDVPLVLLMHVGAFEARMLPRLLATYRELGASFVTLDQAEADPFYRADTGADAAGPVLLGGSDGKDSLARLDASCRP